MADLRKVENDHALRMTHELSVRRDWIRAYRVTYGELIAQFPDDRRRVESYFRPHTSRNGRSETPSQQTPPAQPGSPQA